MCRSRNLRHDSIKSPTYLTALFGAARLWLEWTTPADTIVQDFVQIMLIMSADSEAFISRSWIHQQPLRPAPLDKLFLRMIAERFHCSFHDGSFRKYHCAGAVPQLFISCQEPQTCVTLYTPLSDGYRNCTLPVFCFFFSDNRGLSRPGTVR